jgi:hypothetical protein
LLTYSLAQGIALTSHLPIEFGMKRGEMLIFSSEMVMSGNQQEVTGYLK